jgi:hypothetical protein
MNIQRSTALIFAVLLVWAVSSRAESGVDPRLKTFATQKHKQTEELASKLHLDVPPEVREFFKPAEQGDANGVSNAFVKIQPSLGGRHANVFDGMNSVLWIPISETRFAYEQFGMWDGAVLEKYAHGILSSLPPGSVYFGGTDPGRFVITMFQTTTKSPDIFIITQNQLVDMRYADYLRLTMGERIWLPSADEVKRATQKYATSLQERQARGERLGPDEQVDSAGNVRGLAAVMNMNGIIARMILDHNNSSHEFYVEESYVIAWTYPYMEPHGLILKLNKEPLDKLDPAAIERDRQFWAKLSKELLVDPKFLGNEWARKTYSKLRSAIGGLYAYRKLRGEAEAAYKQAITLYPASPEANFRLAQQYTEQGQRDEAIRVLEQLQKLDPSNDKIGAAIQQVRNVPRQPDEKK